MKSPLLIAMLPSLILALLTLSLPTFAADKTDPAQPFEWKHAEWRDPSKVLTEVVWDNLPLGEVVSTLRDQFTNYFDVVIPEVLPEAHRSEPAIGPDGKPIPREAVEVASLSIKLRLKDVKASEMFNAMNLKFELDRIPLRWELLVNGRRPTAVLRGFEVVNSTRSLPQPEAKSRAVFFVGDVVDSRRGDRGFSDVLGLLLEVAQDAASAKLKFSVHEKAELIVITGSDDEIALIRETLAALKQKAEYQRMKTAEAKPASPASSK